MTAAPPFGALAIRLKKGQAAIDTADRAATLPARWVDKAKGLMIQRRWNGSDKPTDAEKLLSATGEAAMLAEAHRQGEIEQRVAYRAAADEMEATADGLVAACCLAATDLRQRAAAIKAALS